MDTLELVQKAYNYYDYLEQKLKTEEALGKHTEVQDSFYGLTCASTIKDSSICNSLKNEFKKFIDLHDSWKNDILVNRLLYKFLNEEHFYYDGTIHSSYDMDILDTILQYIEEIQ